MSGTPVHGHQADYVGITQESTYGVNPIADFTVPSTYCNPVFTNEDNAPSATTNKLDEKVEKVLNTRHLASLTDNKNGRTDYTLSLGGNIKNGGFGYILQTVFQVNSWDGTDMNYKIEEDGNTCRPNSYHFYVPRECSGTRSAFIAGGCAPLTLDIDHKTQIWTATFNCSTKNEAPGATAIPGDDNYRDIATIDKSNYDETFGQFTIDGDTQETTALTQNITYTHAENLGFYGADGKRTSFVVVGVASTISFTLPYSDTIETDNKSKTYWLGADGEVQTGTFGITNTSDANNSFTMTCNGSMTGIVRDTPGSELWSFSGVINVQQNKDDSATDLVITHKDALGDITANF